MADFILDAFDWVMGHLVMPLVLLLVVLFVLALPVLGYAWWKQSNSPTFTLYKNQWACTNMQRVPITTYVQSGNVMVPVTTYADECHQWSRQP